jgi:hypothetical protein
MFNSEVWKAEFGTDVQSAIIGLAHQLGVRDISQRGGAWEYQIDENWRVALNAQAPPVSIAPAGCMAVDLPGYHVAVWYQGWVWGLFHITHGGQINQGDGANEGAFIRAVVAHLTARQQPVN